MQDCKEMISYSVSVSLDELVDGNSEVRSSWQLSTSLAHHSFDWRREHDGKNSALRLRGRSLQASNSVFFFPNQPTNQAMKQEKHQKNQWSSLKLQGPREKGTGQLFGAWKGRRPAGAPRGRWRSTEMIDLFLLEPCCCCCCVLTNFSCGGHGHVCVPACKRKNPSTG